MVFSKISVYRSHCIAEQQHNQITDLNRPEWPGKCICVPSLSQSCVIGIRIADREEKSVDALASEKLDKRGNESVKPKKKAIAVKFAVRLKQIETTNNKAKDSEEAKPAGLAGLMAYDSSSED